MTPDDCIARLREMEMAAAINQAYNQKIEWWWARFDQLIRIAVGVVAIASVVLGFLGQEYVAWSLGTSVIGLVAAFALNVVPFGDYQKFYADFQRRWSDFRQDIELLIVSIECAGGDCSDPFHLERMAQLIARECAIEAGESAPWRRIMDNCQEDENERRWGKGIRTPGQVAKERERREAAQATSTEAVAG